MKKLTYSYKKSHKRYILKVLRHNTGQEVPYFHYGLLGEIQRTKVDLMQHMKTSDKQKPDDPLTY